MEKRDQEISELKGKAEELEQKYGREEKKFAQLNPLLVKKNEPEPPKKGSKTPLKEASSNKNAGAN